MASSQSGMSPVAKALWYIESRFNGDITLADIATAACVSRYHLARAFSATTGWSVMRYVRARRLTEAARALATGAPDILTVALSAGYGSHEAFTRAFRDQLGITPDAVRNARQLDCLNLVEALKMDETPDTSVAPSRFEQRRAFLVAGLGARYTVETNQGIPMLWQKLIPHIGSVPGQIGATTYGVCCRFEEDGSFEYIAGVEAASADGLGKTYRCIEIPANRYAVFTHRGHISGIRRTVYGIWNHWLPASGFEQMPAPDFERYDDRFDPESGYGDVEIWIAVRAAD